MRRMILEGQDDVQNASLAECRQRGCKRSLLLMHLVPMARFARIIYALMLLAVAAFSAFGFLATFEPSDHNILLWRIGYAAVGIGAAVAAAWFLRPRADRSSAARADSRPKR